MKQEIRETSDRDSTIASHRIRKKENEKREERKRNHFFKPDEENKLIALKKQRLTLRITGTFFAA